MKYHIKPSIIKDRERGYISGFFVGDGNIFIDEEAGIYRLRYFLWIKEVKIQQKLLGILQKLHPNVRNSPEKNNTYIIEVHSKELLKYITNVCNKDGLINLTTQKEFLKGFIEGLIDSDGYVQRNFVEITTANKNLRDNIVKLIKLINAKPKIRTYVSPISGKTGWRVGFSLIGLNLNPVKWVSILQTAESQMA